MFDTLTLKTLMFAEVILVLLLVCLLLSLYISKQRRLYQLLLEQYRTIRRDLTAYERAGAQRQTHGKNTQQVDHVAQYLTQTRAEAHARFHKFTQATIPRLAPEMPFSAKVAALRFIYAEAEAEIYKQPSSLQGKWTTLDRKLAEVIRWIGTENQHQKPQQNHRLRLLQERVDTLKPFEIENVRLQRQLAMARGRQKKLELYHAESQEIIARLEKNVRTLQRGGAQKNKVDQHAAADLQHARVAHDRSVGQLDSISDISGQKSQLFQRIIDELRNAYQNISPEQRDALEETIKSLEIDLLKSHQHINNLKKELSIAHDDLDQRLPGIFTRDSQRPATLAENMARSAGHSPSEQADKIEDVLKVIHTNLAETEYALNQTLTTGSPAHHQRTLVEIDKLRLNNQNQRNIIIHLEKELRALRKEALETDDEAVSFEKNRDIIRLEELVKECGYCIETLESQVDLLHMRLQETHQQSELETNDPDVVRLNDELETTHRQLHETIKQYQRTSILNRFTVDMLTCHSVEDIARRIIQVIKDLGIIAGFELHSPLGKAEFYVGNHFNDNEKKLVSSAASNSEISYLNEGILVRNSHFQLLMKNPPNSDEEQSAIEMTLIHLINIAADRLEHIEAEARLDKTEQNLSQWITANKDYLTGLDSQHTLQTEESGRLINNLVHELKRATEMIDMNVNVRAVFDNAISECQDQIDALLEENHVADQNFTRLFKDLEEIYRINNA